MKRTNYTGSIAFLWKALLGYFAYYLFFPMWLPAVLNKWRGVRIANARKVYIAPNVLIDTIYPEAVTIEDEVYLTRGVKVIAHFNPTNPIAELSGIDSEIRPVRIGHGTFVGVNAIILPGVDIGRCCIVGAGAVVTKSAPDFSILGGNPASVIGDVRSLKRGQANA
jgi:acetyltransferase-like isoleucine patch superfamily enzyme